MVKLSDVCSFYSGTGFPKNYQGKVTGKYPFYKVGDISKNVLQGNIRLVNAENYIDDIVVKSIKGTIIPKNTIVFAKIGEALKLNRRAITNCNCLIDNNVIGVKPNDEVLSINYFYYFMCSLKMENISEATTIPSVKKSNLEKININVPSFKEQEHISSTISKVDSLINLCKKQLSKLDELIKSRFVEMFGDIIFNNLNWDIYLWKDVLSIKNGRNQKQVENPNGKYPICGSGGIMGYADDYITNENSIIIGRKGNINKPILMKEKFWNVDTAFGIEPKTSILNVEYLFFFCLFFDFEKLNKAVTIPSLTKSDLLNIKMPIPPIELQNEFAEFVEQVEKSKKDIQQSIEKLETLKKSLMQEYFG